MSSSPLEGFLAPPPQKKRQQRGRMMLIPQSKSPLYPQHTHHHTSSVSLSSHRVTVKLALPLSVCLLSCSVISFFSSPLSRKECVSCRSTSQCQGAKQPILVSDSVTESQRCLKDSKNSSFCTHNSDAT